MWARWFPQSVCFFVSCANPHFSVALGVCCHCSELQVLTCSIIKRSSLVVQTVKSLPAMWKIPWRRTWQPTPVFLPGEFRGQRSQEGCSPWGRKESDTTEQLTHTHTHTHTHCRKSTGLKVWRSGFGSFMKNENPVYFHMVAHMSNSFEKQWDLGEATQSSLALVLYLENQEGWNKSVCSWSIFLGALIWWTS